MLQKKVSECEKEAKNYVIEGFPRTKVQALALEEIGVIPDKIINLEVPQSKTREAIQKKVFANKPELQSEPARLEKIVDSCMQEYQLNWTDIKGHFKNYIFSVHTNERTKTQVEMNVIRMVSMYFNKKSPRRCAGIIVVGPPGSGKNTQARLIAEQFGLVLVSVRDLLEKHAKEFPEIGQMIKRQFIAGNPVPDNIINSLVEDRMKQTDCQLNGWVLEGYPTSENQINQMIAMGLKPKCVFLMQMGEEECIKRLGDRRVDPTTGEKYNL